MTVYSKPDYGRALRPDESVTYRRLSDTICADEIRWSYRPTQLGRST
jgi:hypothetical protein